MAIHSQSGNLRARRCAWRASGSAATAVFAMACGVGFRTVWSWDIGFYLALGRWIVQHRAVPVLDPLTFTLADRPFVDMYWLYEVAAWALHAVGGATALIVAHLAATLASMALALARVRLRGRGGLLPAVMLLVPFVLGSTWEIRPQVASWLYLNLLLAILERRVRDRHAAGLWAIPLVMILWVNTHALFALGVAVLSLHAVPELLRGRAADLGLLIAAAAGAAVCLLNPYGWEGLMVPLAQFRNLQGDSVFKGASGILEYRGLWDFSAYRGGGAALGYQPMVHMHIWLLAGVATIPFAWRRARWGERLVLLATLVAFLGARKNFGYFVFASLPMAADGATVLARLALRRWATPTRVFPRGLAAGMAALTVVACSVVLLHVRSGYYQHGRRTANRFGSGFNAKMLPVRAAAFLNRPEIPAQGHLLNALHDGGYLSFATGRPVFIDGRLELGGPAWYAQHVRTVHPKDLGQTVVDYDIQLVVVPYGDLPTWFQAFASHEAWRCVHLDDYSGVFFRSDFAPTLPDVRHTDAGRPPAPAPSDALALLERARRLRTPGWTGSLWGTQYYPLSEIRLCRAYLELGLPQQSLRVGFEGLRRTTFPAPALLLNQGNAYWQMRQRSLASLCYRLWLSSDQACNAPALQRDTIRARIAEAGPGPVFP